MSDAAPGTPPVFPDRSAPNGDVPTARDWAGARKVARKLAWALGVLAIGGGGAMGGVRLLGGSEAPVTAPVAAADGRYATKGDMAAIEAKVDVVREELHSLKDAVLNTQVSVMDLSRSVREFRDSARRR